MADPLKDTAALPAPTVTLGDRGFALLQRLLPQHALSRLAFALARLEWRWWKRLQIRWFIRRYGVDMSIAREPDPEAYPHFNAFFTRALRPEARPVAPGEGTVVSPVDGTVSQAGIAAAGRLLQAKGHTYTLDALLGDGVLASEFRDGLYVTLYLAPRDYHRFHMPLTGRLRMMRYIPGALFSVNDSTARTIPGLFARNERLVTLFDTDAGPMAVVLVGAMLVAAMETVWSHGVVTAGAQRLPRTWDYGEEDAAVTLQRGAELGRFNMGSTVIVLFGPGRAVWTASLTPGAPVRMGQRLGERRRD
jgi:phosphatidylserine decarboxylase